jgi:hypothetical protein
MIIKQLISNINIVLATFIFVFSTCFNTVNVSTAVLASEINQQPNLTAQPATLDEYWQGKAEWKLVKKVNSTEPATYQSPTYSTKMDSDFKHRQSGSGSYFVTAKGVLYWFHRITGWVGTNDFAVNKCADGFPKMSYGVRKSFDNGNTWTPSIEIIPSIAGSEYECVATDGGFYYEQTTDKWHSLF